jgi:hypothetical protein
MPELQDISGASGPITLKQLARAIARARHNADDRWADYLGDAAAVLEALMQGAVRQSYMSAPNFLHAIIKVQRSAS